MVAYTPCCKMKLDLSCSQEEKLQMCYPLLQGVIASEKAQNYGTKIEKHRAGFTQ